MGLKNKSIKLSNDLLEIFQPDEFKNVMLMYSIGDFISATVVSYYAMLFPSFRCYRGENYFRLHAIVKFYGHSATCKNNYRHNTYMYYRYNTFMKLDHILIYN